MTRMLWRGCSGPCSTSDDQGLEVLTCAVLASLLTDDSGRNADTRTDLAGERPSPHLFQLRPSRHLLREQRGLDAMEEALEPADQLSLRDSQLGLARHVPFVERQCQPVEFFAQFRCKTLFEFRYRGLVNLFQPPPSGLVQRSRPNLLRFATENASTQPPRAVDDSKERKLLRCAGSRCGEDGHRTQVATRKRLPQCTASIDFHLTHDYARSFQFEPFGLGINWADAVTEA